MVCFLSTGLGIRNHRKRMNFEVYWSIIDRGLVESAENLNLSQGWIFQDNDCIRLGKLVHGFRKDKLTYLNGKVNHQTIIQLKISGELKLKTQKIQEVLSN